MPSNKPLALRCRPVRAPSLEILENLGLFPTRYLIEGDNYNARATESPAQGGKEYMTLEQMRHHLSHIQKLVPYNVRHHSAAFRPTPRI